MKIEGIDLDNDWNSHHSPSELYRIYKILREAIYWARFFYREYSRLKLDNKILMKDRNYWRKYAKTLEKKLTKETGVYIEKFY